MTQRVRRGAAWAAIGNILLRLSGLGITALTARLLSKEDFGVFAVALAVYLVVMSLAELGMGSAIARSATEPGDIAPTVVTISLGISLVLGLLMATFADGFAALVGTSQAAGPIRVLSLCLILTGVVAVPGAQLTREFRQSRILAANIAGFFPSTAVLVGLALLGGGATAFAWSRVVGQITTGLIMVLSVKRLYLPGWAPSVVKRLLLFGLPLSAANLVNWSLLNADYVIISRLLTAAEVGVYMIAFSVASWSTTVLGGVLNGIVVPAFGRVKDDAAGLATALISACRLVGLVAIPIGCLSIALAEPLIRTVFGPKWAEAAPLLQVLAVYGVLFSLSLLFANVLVATGATARLLVIQIAWLVLLVPAMVVGTRIGGLPFVAWAHVAVMVVVVVPAYVYLVGRVTQVRVRDTVRPLCRPLGAGVIAAGVAWFLGSIQAEAWRGLLTGAVVAGGVYVALVWSLVRAYVPSRLRTRFPIWPRFRPGEAE